MKQRTDSPCTSLKRPEITPGRPVNRAGNVSYTKNSNERATFSRYLYPHDIYILAIYITSDSPKSYRNMKFD